jgi:L-ascorbate metabolism protein UlaG (beta-lactamase superfamily)
MTKSEQYTFNPELKFIKINWTGNPLDEDGNFRNIEYPFNNDFTRLIKWQLSKNPQKEEKENDTFRLKVINAEKFLVDDRDGMIWVGHSTFLFRIKGQLIITDPVFTEPSFFMKRFSKLPINPDKIKNLDYILISHDHYDHLNEESFKLLIKNNPKVKILTGLKLGEYIKGWSNGQEIQEAGWYQQYNITSHNLKITFLPTRHWSKRGISSANKHLWGAFMIQSDSLSIYFGGDSGWGSHFAEVKELFGNPDYSIIGIGAYKPEWFMSQAHTSPEDALRGALATGCRNFIPMHFGTFDLADEPIGDPFREVQKRHEKYKQEFDLNLPNIGEVISF